mgnify:CR=1 FL=1
MKCIAFSGKSIHSIEDQINYFLEENESVKILNIDISTNERGAYAAVIYDDGYDRWGNEL